MANLINVFEQYGIKEVADVTIYKLTKEADGTTKEEPFLFLDTLKVSTIEQTAEQSDARGGKGNSKLITWDYGKEINITLEDALYSPKSMAMMWGGDKATWVSISTITKMLKHTPPTGTTLSSFKDDRGNTWNVAGYIDDTGAFVSATSFAATAGKTYTIMATASAATSGKLTIEADDFPGTYKLVGDTYARNRDTGEDEYFQFIIPRAKMSAEQTLTLEAEGDPSTFNLNMTVLRPQDGKMIELVQYTLGN